MGRAHAPPRRRARRPGDLRRRARGHLRVELGAPPRALLRRALHRSRAAHAQHPAVPRAAALRRRRRRGRGDLRRPLAAEAAVAADRRAADGQARRRDGRRRRGRDPRRRADPRLRVAARRGRAGRVPGRGREQRRGDVLHERHHRQPEGRRLLAPLERPALHELDVRRHARGLRGRRDPAGRADVPRQRVGARAGRRAGRLDVRDARPRPLAEGDRGPDGVREGDVRRWRPDDLDGRARRARRARPLLADPDPVRRLGRPEVAVGGLPREDRRADDAGLGHDGDEPARLRELHQELAARALRGGAGRRPRAAGAPLAARRDPHRRTPTPTRRSRGTASRAARSSARARGSPRATSAAPARRSSPTTAGCARATSA